MNVRLTAKVMKHEIDEDSDKIKVNLVVSGRHSHIESGGKIAEPGVFAYAAISLLVHPDSAGLFPIGSENPITIDVPDRLGPQEWLDASDVNYCLLKETACS